VRHQVRKVLRFLSCRTAAAKGLRIVLDLPEILLVAGVCRVDLEGSCRIAW